MEQNPFYNIFANIFANNTSELLVRTFNHEVGSTGFNSMRAAYDAALIDEFLRRDIDVSAIYDGTVIKFSKEIALDETGKRVIVLQ